MSAGRTRRIFLLCAAVIVLVVLIGTTYQGVTTAVERRRFPFPGRLVDAGGHQLHLHCTGTGTPTVVLEAPAVVMSSAWGWVQARLSALTRVCSYDRAGLGWSEGSEEGFDPSRVPRELHALLGTAGEAQPYVLAGQGLGASFARLYGSLYSEELSGLVLVDLPPADRMGPSPDLLRLINAAPWLARTGVLRGMQLLSSETRGLPAASAGSLATFLNRPDHLTRAGLEVRAWESVARAAAAASIPATLRVEELKTAQTGLVSTPASRTNADHVSEALESLVRATREIAP